MQDKVITVTGGANGIGTETSRRLATEGALIVIADINSDQGQAEAVGIVARGGKAIFAECDIANPELCEGASQAAVDHFGRIDGLVNCAGISRPHDSISLPPSDWASMVDVQLSGAFYIAQACAKRMWAEGGAIVFITSTNAEAAFPRRAAYCSAKAGVAMLTKVLAVEWAARRIRVNAVGPAYVATEMTQRNIEAGNLSEAQIKARIPLGRLAQPGDVADAVSFLLSDQAKFIGSIVVRRRRLVGLRVFLRASICLPVLGYGTNTGRLPGTYQHWASQAWWGKQIAGHGPTRCS